MTGSSMNAETNVVVSVSGILIRADGTRIDLGTLSNSEFNKVQEIKNWIRIKLIQRNDFIGRLFRGKMI